MLKVSAAKRLQKQAGFDLTVGHRTLSDQKIQMSDQFYDLSDILSNRVFCQLEIGFALLFVYGFLIFD